MITALITLAIIAAVVTFWRWYASRPNDEAGTRAMIKEKKHLEKMAKKYPYKGDK